MTSPRKYEASGLIRRLPHYSLLRLSLSEGVCDGAVIRDLYAGGTLLCPGPVILALGGMNGLFPGMTTGTTQNTGDGLAAVFAQGAELANLEMLQYHPTTVAVTGKRLLISEAARGEGGRLFVRRNGEKWYFMEELYPELANLMPRDVISREMARLSGDHACEGPFYLDLTGLPRETWQKRLPDLREEIRQYLKLDPAREPVPVSPGIHFFMGGLWVDEAHRTSIPGLYAAGECACQYHGANRLGGNSLLGALYGGLVAAGSAAACEPGGDAEPRPLPEEPEPRVSPAFARALGETLRAGLDILRDGAGLRAALDRLNGLGPQTEAERARLDLGRAMLLSALAREESRGAHTRTDFPARDDGRFRKTTVAALRGGEVKITFREIPERRVTEP